jgi:hypothetical protein
MPTTFFRAVSLAELRDWRQCGKLRAAPSSCEGKHLAYTLKDARRWGRILHGPGHFSVLRVVLPEAVATGLFGWDRLDGIGPACFATIEELDEAEVAEVTNEP